MSRLYLQPRRTWSPMLAFWSALIVALSFTATFGVLLALDGEDRHLATVLSAEEQEDGQGETAVLDQEVLPLSTITVALTRDPFEPVRPEPPPTVPVTDTNGSDNDGGADDPADPQDPGTPGNGDGEHCTTNGEAVCDGHVLKVLDVVADGAMISVDGETHTVPVGQQFAGNFRLLQTNGECARIQYGDADIFWQCVGDSTTK